MLLTTNKALNIPLFLYLALDTMNNSVTCNKANNHENKPIGINDHYILRKWLGITVDREVELLFSDTLIGRSCVVSHTLSNLYKCKQNYVLYHLDIVRYYLLQDYFEDTTLAKQLLIT